MKIFFDTHSDIYGNIFQNFEYLRQNSHILTIHIVPTEIYGNSLQWKCVVPFKLSPLVLTYSTGSFTMKCTKVKAQITPKYWLQFQNKALEPPLHQEINENVRQISLSQMLPEIWLFFCRIHLLKPNLFMYWIAMKY